MYLIWVQMRNWNFFQGLGCKVVQLCRKKYDLLRLTDRNILIHSASLKWKRFISFYNVNCVRCVLDDNGGARACVCANKLYYFVIAISLTNSQGLVNYIGFPLPSFPFSLSLSHSLFRYFHLHFHNSMNRFVF